MLDFNSEQEQRTRNNGPVPAGSRVLVHLTLEKPKYSIHENEYISTTKGGLLGLWVKFEVATGTFEGVSWYENLWLPANQQNIRLTNGQTTACAIAGAKVRAIIESARGVLPKDTSPQASRKRQIADWLDLSNMAFPIVVGIGEEPYQGKDGKYYWNNTTFRIVTPDSKEYAALMRGEEIITDGPVVGEGGAPQSASSDPVDTGMPWDVPANDRVPAFSSASNCMDDVPF